MATTITRGELRAVLESWTRGELTPGQVHAWAEDRYAASAYEPEDEVANEVLAQLDMLDMNLTTMADVPALLAALARPGGETEEAIADLYRYFESIDITARMGECVADPLYASFCGAAARRPPN